MHKQNHVLMALEISGLVDTTYRNQNLLLKLCKMKYYNIT